jgi:dTDP-4-dehydrorhamnose 3,5-epimerase
MGSVSLNDTSVTPLKRIAVTGGDVLHALKNSDYGYAGFGEAYFSQVESGAVKAWKRHRQMTLNLVVPVGEVHFVFIDSTGSRREEIIGDGNYVRLTVTPGIWFGFKGVAEGSSLLLNIANIVHTPDEVERKELSEIKYDWSAI